ncbi:hypothetical protein [Streptomyces spectabilis]|uniref:Uncharacterized protein n=1 Tax=Streptomyces spectabilis TaxID=68270 RepID=A0A5P2X2U4_STRST|nr:hypothetical protein [Streptomyces spectabilis]MBB5105738.1 hypothetical protein [Streptomyces spectabilis]MCI3901272.1 hypothetical protein [Streptomyces spectabilis]QEV58751.1 hypothetical protein CP982_08475 [Streptomyces spectabilis]GGV23825.1 hypothetical protein GCM10010245_39470 [Streptomyces spectabilis]
MIQIQAALFWAYAVGATFALAAGRQLQVWERINAGEGPRTRSRAANPYLALTLLFAAVLMVPTGLFLLWQNPSWATMHVAGGHDGVWAGFVLLYAGGIPVGAVLGFLAAQVLVLVGAGYWAYLQCVGGYFLLFGVLVHGWDGSGYERFLSPGARDWADWPQDGVVNNALDFLTSGTFLALLVFGAAVIGTMLITEIGWLMEGWSLPGADEDRKVHRVLAVAIAAAGVHGLPLLGAVTASALVRLLGAWLGLPLFAVLAGLVLLPRRSPVRLLYDLVGVPHRHWRAGLDDTTAGMTGVTSDRSA